MTRLHGRVAPGFEPVAAAFRENFEVRDDVGAAVALTLHGEPVVDLWAGEAAPGVPWAEDTMVMVFSVTKGPTALVLQLLSEAGAVDIDRRVADYWPEFASNGKQDVTVRQILTHTSGVVTVDGYEATIGDVEWWSDLDRIAASFEGAEPSWEPGSAHGYHGVSYGLLLGEVVRRATGETLGTAFRRLVAEPLGGLDFWIGLPTEHHHRVAPLIDSPPVTDPLVTAYLSMFTSEHLPGRAHFIGPDGIMKVGELMNDSAGWPAEFPSFGGIGTARSLATMYGILAGGGGALTTPEGIAAATVEQVGGSDLVLVYETRFGLGYMLPTPFVALGPGRRSFGHGGLGGSTAFADPDAGIGFAYVMNQLIFPGLQATTRAGALIDAVYQSLPAGDRE